MHNKRLINVSTLQSASASISPTKVGATTAGPSNSGGASGDPAVLLCLPDATGQGASVAAADWLRPGRRIGDSERYELVERLSDTRARGRPHVPLLDHAARSSLVRVSLSFVHAQGDAIVWCECVCARVCVLCVVHVLCVVCVFCVSFQKRAHCGPVVTGNRLSGSPATARGGA